MVVVVAPKGRPSEVARAPKAVAEREAEGATDPLWSAPAPVVMTDATGEICFVNRAAAVLLGAGFADLVGRPLVGLVRPEDRGLVARRTRAVVDGMVTRDLLVPIQAGDRILPCLVGAAASGDESPTTRVTWVLVRPSAWPQDSGPGDVTDVAVALSRLSRTGSAKVEPLRRMGQAAAWCREATGNGSEVGLVVWDYDGERLVASTSDTAQSLALAQFDVGQGPVVVASNGGEAVRVVDLSLDARYPALVGAVPPGHSVISCPVTVDDAVVGALTVYDARPDLLHDEDVVFPSLAAATSAIAAEVTLA